MDFAVMHIQKNGNSVGGLGKHIDRSHTPENADKEKAQLNEQIINHDGDLGKAINDRIKEGYTGKKAVRKDAVKSLSIILSGSHDKMKEIEAKGKLPDWVKDNHQYLKDRYGEKNIVSLAVHRDERTAHMHAVIVPLTGDGRLSAKEIMGNRGDLKKEQTIYAEKMKKYGLERGIEGSRAKHQTVKEYYRKLEHPLDTQIKMPKQGWFEGKDKYQERVKEAVIPLAEAASRSNDAIRQAEKRERTAQRQIKENQERLEADRKMIRHPLEVHKRHAAKAEIKLEDFKEKVMNMDEMDLKVYQAMEKQKERGQNRDKGMDRGFEMGF